MALFDPSFPIEASGAVAVRELARSASAFLNRVERDGEVIAVHRFGRLVAVLAPLPEHLVVRFENDPPPARRQPEIDIDIPDWLEKSEAAQAILSYALQNHPMPYSIDGVVAASRLPLRDVQINKSMLELEGFADQTLRGNLRTPMGVAAARLLKGRLDTRNDPPAS